MPKEKKQVNIQDLLFGKIPPQCIDIENSIIGAILTDTSVLPIIKELLNENDFYKEENAIIYKCIIDISEHNIPDLNLLVEKLRSIEKLDFVGGAFSVVGYMNKFELKSLTNIKQYCLMVKQKSTLRKLIKLGSTILTKANDETEDVFDILFEAETILKNTSIELDELTTIPNSEVALKVIEKFDKTVYNARNNIEDEDLVYTGMTEWDKINGSLFNGLYIIAGRPAMGKGVHMTELICRMAKKYPIGVINGEMTNEQLLKRIGCNLMGIDNYLFKKNPKFITDEESEKLHEAMNEALNLKLHLETNRYIHKIINRIKIWKEQFGIKCVLADFLTLFKVHSDLERYFTETQKVNYILDAFVNVCREQELPIILYVQMNRQILGRHGEKEPNLSDLKQSGAIEEMAYQVSFLHRPEYYDATAIVDDMGESTKGLMYQIIAKHRDGEIGRLKFKAKLEYSKLEDWNDTPFNNFKPLGDMPF